MSRDLPVRQTGDPDGPRGGFHQDQVWTLSPDGIEAWRHQRFRDKGAPDGCTWREWTDRYGPVPGAEDPISAVYALRLKTTPGPHHYPIFSGTEAWALEARPLGVERVDAGPLGTISALKYELFTHHAGDLEQKGRFFVWLSEDAWRVPVQVEVRTNFGPVTGQLTEYAGGAPVGAPR